MIMYNVYDVYGNLWLFVKRLLNGYVNEVKII